MFDPTVIFLLVVGLIFFIIQLANLPYYIAKAQRREKDKKTKFKKRGNIRLKGKSYYEDNWDRRQ